MVWARGGVQYMKSMQMLQTRRHRRPARSDAAGARSLQVLRAARERGPARQGSRAQPSTLLPEQRRSVAATLKEPELSRRSQQWYCNTYTHILYCRGNNNPILIIFILFNYRAVGHKLTYKK